MESLQIRTGRINLQILDDNGNERGIFSFSPSDIMIAKQILALQQEISDKDKEFREKASELTEPLEQAKLLDEYIEYFESSIDRIYGNGTSKILFGDAKTLEMFEDFFNGIQPYYQQASKARLAKYKKAIKPKK